MKAIRPVQMARQVENSAATLPKMIESCENINTQTNVVNKILEV